MSAKAESITPWAESLLNEAGATMMPIQAGVMRSEFAERSGENYRDANLWLRSHLSGSAAVELLITKGLKVKEAAGYLAQRFAFCGDHAGAVRTAIRMGVPMPRGRTEEGAISRAKSPHYWRRWLRIELSRWKEARRRDTGLVRAQAGKFISEESLQKIRARDEESARFLAEEMTAVSDHGDEKSVAELAASSPTQPHHRGVELMIRSKGFEEYAAREGHPWTFVTISLPGEWHAFYEDTGRRVKRFNGERPDKAHMELMAIWHRCRAQLHREKIRYYGFRVVEPHHDATPHWHALIFCESDTHLADFKQTIRDHFAPNLPDDHPRVKFEDHDPTKGGAADYMGKYVAKNISGSGLDDDERPSVERVRAWVRLWGVQQFAQLGGPPVGVYRELRKIHDRTLVPVSMLAAWDAADSHDWCAFIDAMGGPFAGRAERPIAALRGDKVGINGERSPSVNGYGEPLRTLDYDVRPIVGLNCGDDELITYQKVWKIEFRKPPAPAAARADAICDGGAGGAWTRVDNCTAGPWEARPPP